MTKVSRAPTAPVARASLRYVPGIDGLRAVSVLAVLVYHYFELGQAGGLGGPMHNWMPGGFMGVEVFFVISGYLITALLLAERRRTGRIALGAFWLRRARRLLPALALMLAVVVCYALAFLPDAIDDLRRDVVGAVTYTSNWWQIDLPYAAQEGRPPLLRHLWSLAIEEQFYLVWPIALVAGLKHLGRTRMLAATVGTALASAVLMAAVRGDGLGATDPSAAYFSTVTRLSGLLLGSALAFVWVPYRIRRRPGRGARLLLDAAGAAGLFVLWHAFRTWHFEDPGTFRGGFLLVDLATLLVIAATVHPVSDVGRLLALRPLVWVGQRSYGIYLWHYPIFAITRPNLDNTWWPPAVVVVRFGLTLAIAALSYRYVEVPIRQGAIGRYMERVRTARGGHRRRLALGGLGAVLTVSLVAVSLGATLAGADSRRGDEQEAGAGDGEDGDALDPDAIAVICSTAPPGDARLAGLCADVTPTGG
ncbi:MAG TPA: acyltransferase, partial [Candidatus Tectomicrobia bacterium]|nr:acyltransferase [Candidatus Tectomicrobia bacterium]